MLNHYGEILKGRGKRMARDAARTGETSCSSGCVDGNGDVEEPSLFDEHGMSSLLDLHPTLRSP